MQTQLITRKISEIGEEIGLELGTQMVKSYQVANPTDLTAYVLGKNIIEKILAQPGCVGIKFYNAINEKGEKTFVYVGIDENAKVILQYAVVNTAGELGTEKGIVADRIPNSKPGTSIGADELNWWEL